MVLLPLVAITSMLAGVGAACSPYDGAGGLGDRRVPGPPEQAFDARVERVVDGDTFIARHDGHRVRVRLIGVDAPESVRPDSPVECFGPESARLLGRLLPAGSRVRAAYQGRLRSDRFGRDLWDVWLRDGRFVQAELVRAGTAQARAYPPQTRHAELLSALDEAAAEAGRGRYGACPR